MSGSPQTPQSVCGPGELGESLEKHTAGRLLNLKGKDSTGKRGDGAGDTVDLQKTTAKGVVGALLREDVVFSKQKSRFFF